MSGYGFFRPGGFFSGSAPAGSGGGGGGTTWLAEDTTTYSTSGTGEDDLASVVLPQDSHTSDTLVRVYAGGTKTGTAGVKTLKFHFGTQTATFHPAENDEIVWQFEAVILLAGATSHNSLWQGRHVSVTHGIQVFTDDLSAAGITMKVTGECADGADTISQSVFIVGLEQ